MDTHNHTNIIGNQTVDRTLGVFEVLERKILGSEQYDLAKKNAHYFFRTNLFWTFSSVAWVFLEMLCTVLMLILVTVIHASNVAKNMHRELLFSVVKRVTRFFDTVPIGRILHRFELRNTF